LVENTQKKEKKMEKSHISHGKTLCINGCEAAYELATYDRVERDFPDSDVGEYRYQCPKCGNEKTDVRIHR
jgi:hypothetical protein